MKLATNSALGGGCHVTTTGRGRRAPVSRQARARAPAPPNREVWCSVKFGKHRAPLTRGSTLITRYSDEEAPHSPRVHHYRKSSDDEIVELYKDISKLARARRIRKLPIDDEEQSMWDECRLCALDAMDTMTSFRLSNILYRCRMGAYCDIELFEALFRKAKEEPESLGSFHPFGVSMSIQSMGMMAKATKVRGDQKAIRFFKGDGLAFVKQLMEVSVETGILKKPSFGAKELSNALQGLGSYSDAVSTMVGDPTVLTFARTICAEFIVKAGMDGNARDFSSLLQGCAKCGFTDPGYMEQVTALLEMRLTAGTIHPTSRDLVNIIWAVGSAKCVDRSRMDRLTKRAMSFQLSPQQLSMLAHGCALMGYKSPRLLQFYGSQLSDTELLTQFRERDLCNVIYSLFGILRFANMYALLMMGREVIKKHRLKEFTEQGLAMIMFGFRTARFNDPVILEALAKEITQPHRLGKLSDLSLPGLIFAFGVLEYPDNTVFDVLGEEAVEPVRLVRHTESTLSKLLSGLAQAKYGKRSVIDTLANEFVKEHRLQGISCRDLAVVVRSLRSLDYQDEQVWKALETETMKQERLAECSIMQLRDFVWAFESTEEDNQQVVGVVKAEILKAEEAFLKKNS